jgi:hypothetical protein
MSSPISSELGTELERKGICFLGLSCPRTSRTFVHTPLEWCLISSSFSIVHSRTCISRSVVMWSLGRGFTSVCCDALTTWAGLRSHFSVSKLSQLVTMLIRSAHLVSRVSPVLATCYPLQFWAMPCSALRGSGGGFYIRTERLCMKL